MNDTLFKLVQRTREEFEEVAGLRVNVSEAAQFFGLDVEMCEQILSKLYQLGFLAMDDERRYRTRQPEQRETLRTTQHWSLTRKRHLRENTQAAFENGCVVSAQFARFRTFVARPARARIGNRRPTNAPDISQQHAGSSVSARCSQTNPDAARKGPSATIRLPTLGLGAPAAWPTHDRGWSTVHFDSHRRA